MSGKLQNDDKPSVKISKAQKMAKYISKSSNDFREYVIDIIRFDFKTVWRKTADFMKRAWERTKKIAKIGWHEAKKIGNGFKNLYKDVKYVIQY